jgi:hypothetical protein
MDEFFLHIEQIQHLYMIESLVMIVTLYCDNSRLKIGQFELSSRFCTTANQDYNLLTYSQVFGRAQEILKCLEPLSTPSNLPLIALQNKAIYLFSIWFPGAPFTAFFPKLLEFFSGRCSIWAGSTNRDCESSQSEPNWPTLESPTNFSCRGNETCSLVKLPSERLPELRQLCSGSKFWCHLCCVCVI